MNNAKKISPITDMSNEQIEKIYIIMKKHNITSPIYAAWMENDTGNVCIAFENGKWIKM